MNKFTKIFVLGLTVYLSVVPAAVAAPLLDEQGNMDSDTVVTQKVTEGGLTLKAPENISLEEIVASTQIETTTGTLEDFLVDDARGKKTPIGWDATVTMTKFAGTTQLEGEAVSIPFVDPVTGLPNYKLTPQTPVPYNGADDGVSSGIPADLVEKVDDENHTGVSEAVTVMRAEQGEGQGRYGVDLKIDLKVPANSAAAEYVSTMTFTVL
ncbi:MAG: WxL domain-containing protein [Patescibacteria group bacterium]